MSPLLPLQFEHGFYLYDLNTDTPASVKQGACFLKKAVDIRSRQLEWHPRVVQTEIAACCTAGDDKSTLEQAQPCLAAIAPAHGAAAQATELFVDPGTHPNGTAKSRVANPPVERLATVALRILVPLAAKELKGVVLQQTGEQELLLAEEWCGSGKACDPAKVFKDVPLDEFPTAEDDVDEEMESYEDMAAEEDL